MFNAGCNVLQMKLISGTIIKGISLPADVKANIFLNIESYSLKRFLIFVFEFWSLVKYLCRIQC